MPNNPTTLWIIGATETTLSGALETHQHYGFARRARRIRSLLRKYKPQPTIRVFAISPDKTIYWQTQLATTQPTSPSRIAAARAGGTATARARTPEQRRNAASHAARARWNKEPTP